MDGKMTSREKWEGDVGIWADLIWVKEVVVYFYGNSDKGDWKT